MRKSTKGALAGGAGVVLLLGGAGTLAFWTDTQDISNDDVTSGHLKLVNGDCGDGWVLDGGAPFTTSQFLVPGDVLTKVCTYSVDAAGEHLAATFTATGPSDIGGAQPLIDEIVFTSAFKVNGTASGSTDVPIADGDVVTATLTITWPYGVEDNDSNVLAGLTASLADVTVVATQTHDAP
jgi:alternate signal-mediated exported protein